MSSQFEINPSPLYRRPDQVQTKSRRVKRAEALGRKLVAEQHAKEDAQRNNYKTCTVCGQTMPRDRFRVNLGFADNRDNNCKPCRTAKDNKRREERLNQ